MASEAENIHRYVDQLFGEREREYQAEIGEIILSAIEPTDTALWRRAREAVMRRPQQLPETTLPMLRALSDEHALPFWEDAAKDHVVIFKVSFPGSHTEENPGLTIFSIPEGRPGFNTSAGYTQREDNSKRWTVCLDRGTNFGSAYDNRGTAYASGKLDPSIMRGRVDAGEFDTIIQSFYERDDLTIDWEVMQTPEERLAERASSTPTA